MRQPLGTNLEMGSIESRLDLLIDTHLPELSIALPWAYCDLALISGNFNAPPVHIGQVGARKEGEDGNGEASSALPLGSRLIRYEYGKEGLPPYLFQLRFRVSRASFSLLRPSKLPFLQFDMHNFSVRADGHPASSDESYTFRIVAGDTKLFIPQDSNETSASHVELFTTGDRMNQ